MNFIFSYIQTMVKTTLLFIQYMVFLTWGVIECII